MKDYLSRLMVALGTDLLGARTTATVVAVGTALLLVSVSIAQAQSKCDSAKLKAYGKKVFCLTKVDSKAAKKGEPIDTVKEQKCLDKFDASCAKAEERDDCTSAVKSCTDLRNEAETCREAANEEPPPTETPTGTPTETPTPGPVCGNGVIEGAEECDGTDFGGQTCAGLGLGYTGGMLACTPGCQLELFGCTPTYSIDFCRLQFPLVINDLPGASVTVYGRLYVAGLTDQSALNNPAPAVQAWVGYGADGSDPAVDAGWIWFPAVPNPGWDGNAAGEPNNDEYQASLVVPAAGTYDYAYRFSGDSGGTFAHCDGDPGGNTTGYAPGDAGQMTSAP